MNPKQLFLEGNQPTDVWLCSKCRNLFGMAIDKDPQSSAERCCMPYICTGCRVELPREKHRTRCDACCRKDRIEKELKTFDKAKKFQPAEWNGPVFDRNGRYFLDLEAFFDHYHDNKNFIDAGGTWVWCASEIKFEPCVDGMIENALDSHHEDANIFPEHLKKLEDFVAKWAEEACIFSFEPDHTQCVLINYEEEADPCLIKSI